MKSAAMAVLLAVASAVGQTHPATNRSPENPKMTCWDGWSSTKETKPECTTNKHDWIEDQTGKYYPSGDGCNTSTCMDAACRNSVSTLAACAYHPIRIEPAPGPKPTAKPVISDKAAPVEPQKTFDHATSLDWSILTTSSSITFLDADDDCSWGGYIYDPKTKTCNLKITFNVPTPVVCTPLVLNEEGRPTMTCSFKVKAKVIQ